MGAQPYFPLSYLQSPSATSAQDGQGRARHPSTPRHQKAAQILLEQGLPRVGVLQGTARPGLAEGHLPSVVRDFRSQQGHPGRSASGCRIAPCSDRFHNSAGTGHYGVKQRAGCRAGCQKGGCTRGLHPPLPCEGHLGLPHREEQSQHLGQVPTNHLTDKAQLQGHTRTHTLDHGQHSPEDTDEGNVRGRRRWGGSKFWPGTRQSHPDQELCGLCLRAGPPCPIPSAPAPHCSTQHCPGARQAARTMGSQITPPTHLAKSAADCEEN